MGSLLGVTDGQWGAVALIIGSALTAAGASCAAWLTTRRHASDASNNHQAIIDRLERIDSRLGYVERDISALTGRADAIEEYVTNPKEAA